MNPIFSLALQLESFSHQVATGALSPDEHDQIIKRSLQSAQQSEPTYTQKFWGNVFSNPANEIIINLMTILEAQAQSTTLSSLTIETAKKSLQFLADLGMAKGFTLDNRLDRIQGLNNGKSQLIDNEIIMISDMIKNESLKKIHDLRKEVNTLLSNAQLSAKNRAKLCLLFIRFNEVMLPINAYAKVMFDELSCEFFSGLMFDHTPSKAEFQAENDHILMRSEIVFANMIAIDCCNAMNADKLFFCENMVSVIKDLTLLKRCFEVFLDSARQAMPQDKFSAMLEEVILPYLLIHSDTELSEILTVIYNTHTTSLDVNDNSATQAANSPIRQLSANMSELMQNASGNNDSSTSSHSPRSP